MKHDAAPSHRPAVGDHAPDLAPNAERFAPLPSHRAELFAAFYSGTSETFPRLVGIVLEEVRLDYARMRLPFRSQLLNHPAGVVHGGAVAALIDTVVVPAIASGYDDLRRYSTIDMQVQYMDALIGQDAVAEGWIVKRGRSIVFCRAEVLLTSGALVATGTLAYKVSRI